MADNEAGYKIGDIFRSFYLEIDFCIDVHIKSLFRDYKKSADTAVPYCSAGVDGVARAEGAYSGDFLYNTSDEQRALPV